MLKNRNYVLASLLTLALVGCAHNPVTGRSELHLISESEELSIGENNYLPLQQISGGPYTAHPKINQYVQAVGKRLADVADRPSLPYEFEIVNDSQVNAWALPGGKIGIHRGLLSKLRSESALAAVLGHELTHAAARHTANQYQRLILFSTAILIADVSMRNDRNVSTTLTGALLASYLVNLSYSRSDESEADHYGMVYMARSGYDPVGAIEVQELFLSLQDNKSPAASSLLASHPTSEKRLAANRKHAETLVVAKPFHGVKEYKSAMKPMIDAEVAYISYEEAIEAYEKKDYETVHQLIDKSISIESKEALFLHLKALALLDQEMPAQALVSANTAIELNNGYFLFFFTRGRINEALNEVDSALSDYKASQSLLDTEEASKAIKKLKKKIKKSNKAKEAKAAKGENKD